MKKIFISALCLMLLTGCGSRRRQEEQPETAGTETTQETAISKTDTLDRLADAVEQLDGSKKYIADGTCYEPGGTSITYALESDGSGNYRESVSAGDILMEKNWYMNNDDPITYMLKEDGLYFKKGEIINPFLEAARTMYNEIDSLYITEDSNYYLYQAYIGPESYDHFKGLTRWHEKAMREGQKIELDFVVLKQTGRPVSMTSRSNDVNGQLIFTVIFNEFVGSPIELPEGADVAIEYVDPADLAPEQSQEPVAGGWTAAEDETVTEELKAMFDAAAESSEAANLVPMKLLETQVVAGMNYRFLCEEAEAEEGAEKKQYTVVVYKDLAGNAEILEVSEYAEPEPVSAGEAGSEEAPAESAQPQESAAAEGN